MHRYVNRHSILYKCHMNHQLLHGNNVLLYLSLPLFCYLYTSLTLIIHLHGQPPIGMGFLYMEVTQAGLR